MNNTLTEPVNYVRFMTESTADYQYGVMTNPPEVAALLGWTTGRAWFKVEDRHVVRITKWYDVNGNADYKIYLRSGQVLSLFDWAGSVPGRSLVEIQVVKRRVDL